MGRVLNPVSRTRGSDCSYVQLEVLVKCYLIP